MGQLNRVLLMTIFVVAAVMALPHDPASGYESQFSMEQDFQQAKSDYLLKNLHSAADEIRKGASYLRSQAVLAKGEGKKTLMGSYQELVKLADQVEQGKVTSVTQIETCIAHAYYALAKNAYIKSTAFWEWRAIKNTGGNMKTSMKFLEVAFVWAGRKMQADTRETIQKAKDISSKLREKTAGAVDEVERELERMGVEIEKLGSWFTSPARERTLLERKE